MAGMASVVVSILWDCSAEYAISRQKTLTLSRLLRVIEGSALVREGELSRCITFGTIRLLFLRSKRFLALHGDSGILVPRVGGLELFRNSDFPTTIRAFLNPRS